MASESPAPATTPSTRPKKKLPKLPNTHKIQKRPLLHPPIASPRTSSSTPKIIYISATTPFVSTLKRVQKLLSHIESRSSTTNPSQRNKELRQLMRKSDDAGFLKEVGKDVGRDTNGGGEEVILKATGKAVERLMGVAGWFLNEGEGEKYRVRVRTGSVGAVDDVVAKEGEEDEGSRVRRVSCLEVGVSLR